MDAGDYFVHGRDDKRCADSYCVYPDDYSAATAVGVQLLKLDRRLVACKITVFGLVTTLYVPHFVSGGHSLESWAMDLGWTPW